MAVSTSRAHGSPAQAETYDLLKNTARMSTASQDVPMLELSTFSHEVLDVKQDFSKLDLRARRVESSSVFKPQGDCPERVPRPWHLKGLSRALVA